MKEVWKEIELYGLKYRISKGIQCWMVNNPQYCFPINMDTYNLDFQPVTFNDYRKHNLEETSR